MTATLHQVICGLPICIRPDSVAARVTARFVYVVQDGIFCKVGKAKSVEERLAHLSIGNPRPLTMVMRFRFRDHELAHRVEAVAHGRMWGQRVRGEWFEVSPLAACQTICLACADIGLFSYRWDGESVIAECIEIGGNDELRQTRLSLAANDNERMWVTAR